MGDSRLFSVEATGSGSSVLALSATSGHANHLIHPQLAAIEQIVTCSLRLAPAAPRTRGWRRTRRWMA